MAIDTESQATETLLTVTEAAVAKVLEIRDVEEEPETLALRVEITGTAVTSRGQDYTYDLALEPIADAAETDRVYDSNGITVIVPENSIDQLRGAELDLPSNPLQDHLVIRNPNRPPLADDGELELTGTPGEKLHMLIDRRINPSLAMHGGWVELVGMEDETIAHLRMGGGCQGCAMSAATLRQGIEVMIADAVPEITKVVDITDHEAGENPFYD